MKEFYFDVWSNDRKKLKKILCEITERRNNNLPSVLSIVCPEEYDFMQIGNYDLDDLIFDSDLVQTDFFIGAVKNVTLTQLEQQYDNVSVVLWPNFWLYKSVADVDVKNIAKKRNITKLFICLNNVPHPHRIKTFNLLEKKNLLKHGIVSWHHATDSRLKYHRSRKVINNKKIFLKSEKKKKAFLQHVLPEEFNSCLINLVTESTVNSDIVDISEKTVNAIIAQMPFIIIGTPGVHKTLQEWGFELYDEIFDYGFDKFENYNDRIKSVTDQICKIEKTHKNYGALYRTLEPKIIRNKNRLLDIIQNDHFVPEKICRFEKYNKIIESAKRKINEI